MCLFFRAGGRAVPSGMTKAADPVGFRGLEWSGAPSYPMLGALDLLDGPETDVMVGLVVGMLRKRSSARSR